MQAVVSVFLICVVSILLTACGGSVGQSAWGSGGLVAATLTPQALGFEQAMFVRLNRDRAAKGLPALVYDQRLADIARSHSQDMLQNRFFDHHSPTTGSLADRLNRAAYLSTSARENLAVDADVQSAQDHLLQSPGHYANIMADDITHMGIGIIVSGPQIYVTQVFSTPAELESPSVAREQALNRLEEARAHRRAPSLRHNADLDALTAKLAAELNSNRIQQDLQAAGKQLEDGLKALAAANGPRIKSVEFVAQTALRGADIQWPASATTPDITIASLGVAQHTDHQGRPILIVLIVLGKE